MTPPPVDRRHRFFTNVLWNWLGLAVSLLTGVLLAPYIIRKLGAEGYGIWQLAFSMLAYYSLLDLGLRTAVVRFSALYRAKDEPERINELVSTLLVYYLGCSLVLVGITLVVWARADGLFGLPERYREDFATLLLLIGLNFAVGVMVTVFSGCVEGFQRFDVSGRIRIVTFAVRSGGLAALLALDHGLVAMGWWMLFTNLQLGLLYVLSFRRIFPALRVSRRRVRWATWVESVRYGIHAFAASVADQLLVQGPPIVIGLLQPVAAVGYYSLAQRLLSYSGEALSRVGTVVAPQAAELAARDRLDSVARLSVFANRYCVTLFTPLAIVLALHGEQVFRLWVGEEFARHSAPLLPILLPGSLAVASQFGSSAVLFGLGRHRGYAYALLAEALAMLTGMALLLPRHGLVAAAAVASAAMLLVRGLLLPAFLCRHLRHPYGAYMRGILARPLLLGLPVLALGLVTKALWPPQGFLGLGLTAGTLGTLYLVPALFVCLEPDHRQVLLQWRPW